MVSGYFAEIIVLLIAAVIIVPVFQKLKLGSVSGFLVTGVLIGPYGLRLISSIDEISRLAEIGVILLLFVIGIELKPSRLWLMRHLVFGLGSLQLAITGGLLGALAYYFAVPLRSALLIGPTLALSSTAFVLQILTERKQLHSDHGRICFAVLLLQDLAVVPLLALEPLLAKPELGIGMDMGLAFAKSVLALAAVVTVGRYCLHPILHRVALVNSPEVFTASALLIVLGSGFITHSIGLSMALGAFIAGLLISDSSYRHQVIAEIQPFRGLLLGLFFITMGMSLNLNYFFNAPLLTLGVVLALVAIKTFCLWPLVYFFGIGAKSALASAVLLGQSGEFGMVLFGLAHQVGLLQEQLFQQLLLIVLLSMLLTPILAKLSDVLLKQPKLAIVAAVEPMPPAPIVIAGFGRMGRRIGNILTSSGQPYLALDSDAAQVESLRKLGYPVFYGDVRQPEVLKSAGAGNAKILIATLNDTEATGQLVAALRHAYPQLQIFVRGYSLSHCKHLTRLGASRAISENLEASLELARLALTDTPLKDAEKEQILAEFRYTYYAQINSQVDKPD